MIVKKEKESMSNNNMSVSVKDIWVNIAKNPEAEPKWRKLSGTILKASLKENRFLLLSPATQLPDGRKLQPFKWDLKLAQVSHVHRATVVKAMAAAYEAFMAVASEARAVSRAAYSETMEKLNK